MLDIQKSSLDELANYLVKETTILVENANTEEDFKIGFEKLLEPIRSLLNLSYTPKYEKSSYSGRPDALHGKIIIEYKSPNFFSSEKNLKQTQEQLINYLADEINQTHILNLLGIGFDGKKIFFIQYKDTQKEIIDKSKFLIQGPYRFNLETSRTFLIHLRALSRIPLTADSLAKKFGYQTHLSQKMISTLLNSLEHWGEQDHIQTFFAEWKRLFGIVYGEEFFSTQKDSSSLIDSKISNLFLQDILGFQKVLFCIHTYFVFLIKLITAELLTLRETAFNSSLALEFTHISDSELKLKLHDIEDGGVYSRKGITNFLEGDFFRWYLYALDSPALREGIREISRTLSEFEIATSSVEPSLTRDLLKKLYQYLVPEEIRHKLGEYYTPDWLAEFLLNELNYEGDTFKRVLDPSCGSGTFLVLAIQKAKEYGKKENLPPIEIIKKILANIWGFDLNPLAVIASRTNYLFALGELVMEIPRMEIPVYLTDSVLTTTKTSRDLFSEFLEVSTSVGEFKIPAVWVNNQFLFAYATPLLEEMVRNGYSTEEALVRLEKEGLLFPNSRQVVQDFYNRILELEKQNKNGIWARFLKNPFAPAMAGRFDYVVGNPPWVRWSYLSREYREATLDLWKKYGLFSLKGHAARLGGGEKDFSMLFLYASADYYLKESGKLGFLITQEVFKSKGAGEGFRRFQIGNKNYLKVLKAHDLVSIQPFEGAINKTAAIILKKGEKTKYPVTYYVWNKKKGVGKIPTNISFKEASQFLEKKKYQAKPIGNEFGSWQTIAKTFSYLEKISGKNHYLAYRGASTEPYSVFWLEIKQTVFDGNVLIKNLGSRGKKKVQEVEEVIEPDLIFPSVSGANIQRWGVQSYNFLLVVQNPNTREPFLENEMKANWPRTFNYLTKFKKTLLSRASKPIKELSEKIAFYAMYGISSYTFQNYKVVWKRMSSDIVACVVSQIKTEIGYKIIIPTDTTSFFPASSEEEAHYLCAIINSNSVREFIKSFSSAGRGFGSPSVMQHVGIPKFDPKNLLHVQLAEISKNCHKLKLENKDVEIQNLEKENENLVKELFGLEE